MKVFLPEIANLPIFADYSEAAAFIAIKRDWRILTRVRRTADVAFSGPETVVRP